MLCIFLQLRFANIKEIYIKNFDSPQTLRVWGLEIHRISGYVKIEIFRTAKPNVLQVSKIRRIFDSKNFLVPENMTYITFNNKK